MCLIAYLNFAQLDRATTERAVARVLSSTHANRDGMSLATFAGGRWRIQRCARTNADKLAAFLATAEAEGGIVALHLRLATCGRRNIANTHPFRVTTAGGGHAWLYHNGSLWHANDAASDTRELAHILSCARLPLRKLVSVLEAFTDQRFMLLEPSSPEPTIIGSWLTHSENLALSSAILEEKWLWSRYTSTEKSLSLWDWTR